MIDKPINIRSFVNTYKKSYPEGQTREYIKADKKLLDNLGLFNAVRFILCSPYPGDGCWAGYGSLQELRWRVEILIEAGKEDCIVIDERDHVTIYNTPWVRYPDRKSIKMDKTGRPYLFRNLQEWLHDAGKLFIEALNTEPTRQHNPLELGEELVFCAFDSVRSVANEDSFSLHAPDQALLETAMKIEALGKVFTAEKVYTEKDAKKLQNFVKDNCSLELKQEQKAYDKAEDFKP